MSVRTIGAAPLGIHRYRLEAGLAQMSPPERAARGKQARAAVPREATRLRPAPDRPDPVALLQEQAASRVPELVPIRYGRMLVSPFTFYRGAALPMAADLADDPALGLAVQAVRRRAPVATSASSPRRSGGWSSTSTTSTRRCPGRGSGTSSGWPRASRSPAASNGVRRKRPARDRHGRGRPLPDRRCGVRRD